MSRQFERSEYESYEHDQRFQKKSWSDYISNTNRNWLDSYWDEGREKEDYCKIIKTYGSLAA